MGEKFDGKHAKNERLSVSLLNCTDLKTPFNTAHAMFDNSIYVYYILAFGSSLSFTPQFIFRFELKENQKI